MKSVSADSVYSPARRASGTDPRSAPEANAIVAIAPAVMKYIYAAGALIVVLGLFREAYLWVAGTGTVLQDLRHFNLDAERNLGAWYSSLLMAFAALAAFTSFRAHSQTGSGFRYHWMAIAVVFMLMSLDETVGFHETVDVPLRDHFQLTGLLYNPWVVPAAVFVACFGAAMLPFVLRLPGQVRTIFIVSGIIYVSGALGMEPLDALLEERYGAGSMPQTMSTTIEETLEMIGLSLFLHGNLIYLNMLGIGVRFRETGELTSASQAPAAGTASSASA